MSPLGRAGVCHSTATWKEKQQNSVKNVQPQLLELLIWSRLKKIDPPGLPPVMSVLGNLHQTGLIDESLLWLLRC